MKILVNQKDCGQTCEMDFRNEADAQIFLKMEQLIMLDENTFLFQHFTHHKLSYLEGKYISYSVL